MYFLILQMKSLTQRKTKKFVELINPFGKNEIDKYTIHKSGYLNWPIEF